MSLHVHEIRLAEASPRTEVVARAIQDLAEALDQAVTEIHRNTGHISLELIKMADAYRTVARSLHNARMDDAELTVLCGRISSSAEAALILIQSHVRDCNAWQDAVSPTLH